MIKGWEDTPDRKNSISKNLELKRILEHLRLKGSQCHMRPDIRGRKVGGEVEGSQIHADAGTGT